MAHYTTNEQIEIKRNQPWRIWGIKKVTVTPLSEFPIERFSDFCLHYCYHPYSDNQISIWVQCIRQQHKIIIEMNHLNLYYYHSSDRQSTAFVYSHRFMTYKQAYTVVICIVHHVKVITVFYGGLWRRFFLHPPSDRAQKKVLR